MPEVLMGVHNIWEAFDEEGNLAHAEAGKRMKQFAEKIVAYTKMFKENKQYFAK